MADDPDPPRKFYDLKPTTFEQVNERVPPTAPAPDATGAPDPGPVAVDPGPIDVRAMYEQAATPGPALGSAARSATSENDVHVLLRINAARDEAAGLNRIKPKPRRPSRRKRDYWISLLGSNGIVVGTLFLVGPNLVSALFAFAGVVILTCSMTWIFWFILDDY